MYDFKMDMTVNFLQANYLSLPRFIIYHTFFPRFHL